MKAEAGSTGRLALLKPVPVLQVAKSLRLVFVNDSQPGGDHASTACLGHFQVEQRIVARWVPAVEFAAGQLAAASLPDAERERTPADTAVAADAAGELAAASQPDAERERSPADTAMADEATGDPAAAGVPDVTLERTSADTAMPEGGMQQLTADGNALPGPAGNSGAEDAAEQPVTAGSPDADLQPASAAADAAVQPQRPAGQLRRSRRQQ